MQDIYISIGQNIRRRRKEKHLTQESLAANVETSAQYISRIEGGQVCPSLEFLYRLSAALECPIYSLLPSTALLPVSFLRSLPVNSTVVLRNSNSF